MFVSYYNQTDGDLEIARSGDNAETWTNIEVDEAGDVGSCTSIAISSDGNSIYISYHDVGDTALKFPCSDDGGDTW